MTVGENIRRIRKQRGLTLAQLGKEIGVSEEYIRAYESGRRNPKQKNLEAIADALHVNVETLTGADFDGVKAMHRLFQIFRQYPGELIEYKDSEGEDRLAVSFNGLMLMASWFERYEEYQKEIEECNKIKDPKEKANALLAAEDAFYLWMDVYPETETWPDRLRLQKSHDEFMDYIGLNPKNPE